MPATVQARQKHEVTRHYNNLRQTEETGDALYTQKRNHTQYLHYPRNSRGII